MAGYQGTLSEDPIERGNRRHDALAGSETAPGGLEGENPEKDEALRKDIRRGLEAHVELHATNIEVFVKDGFVSLTGTAENNEDKATIEGFVESIDGVKDVVSLIAIDITSDVGQSISGQDDFIVQSPS